MQSETLHQLNQCGMGWHLWRFKGQCHQSDLLVRPTGTMYLCYINRPLLFRYHEDGSKKLNACSLCIFHMVYFKPEHRILLFTDHTSQYLHVRQYLVQPNPCSVFYPLFIYLENQLLLSWCEYPSTLVPGRLTTAPPFASSPTLSHPTDQVTIFT
jgi:hypothetical protein